MRRVLPLLLCIAVSTRIFAQKECGDQEYQLRSISAPADFILQSRRMQSIPDVSSNVITQTISGPQTSGAPVPEVIVIPVVVHVLYNSAQQNISDAQVKSQIEALTKDYRKLNEDRSKVPGYFAPLAADCGFEFSLANRDPSGFATTGIIRKKSNIQMFGFDDRIKSSAKGGDDAWDRNKYLNIWIGNLAGGILGYSSVPGGPAEKDGVVLHYNAIGTTGTVSQPFHLGRTATHEVGHWLNLRHIWGDSYCGDDEVDDTPKQRSSNRGSPAGQKFTCETTGHGDMYMNFMDLTDDASMFMFTPGQRQRMRALFQKGGHRSAILSSDALSGSSLAEQHQLPLQISGASPKVAVFPNPATSAITIEVSGTEAVNFFVVIYNHSGQPVISRLVNSNSTTINISALKEGVYYIKSSKGELKVVKFVKIG